MGCSLDAFKVWCQFEKEDWKTCINATKNTIVVVNTMAYVNYMVPDDSQMWSLTKLSRGVEQTISYSSEKAHGFKKMLGWDDMTIPYESQKCEKDCKNEGTDKYCLKTRIPFKLPVVEVHTKEQGTVTLTVGQVCYY
jgi:hypothetical protein